ncbi:MAG: hypothetical protein J6Q85_02515 [Clostridia bacterium]|nr:hypothetical protein [Clostridia bacterium]
MSARLNKIFFDTYLRVDKLAAEKFGIEKGGVTAYINRLINSRFAPDREETLSSLTKCREMRNVLAHEGGAFDKYGEVTKSDIKWLQGFEGDLSRRRDPISRYLRKSKKYVFRKRLLLAVVVILLAAALGAGVYFLL